MGGLIGFDATQDVAFVPDARSVLAAVISWGQVFGGLTPAFLNAEVEYHTVDLLAPLKTMP